MKLSLLAYNGVILSPKKVNQKIHKSIFPCALPDSTGI